MSLWIHPSGGLYVHWAFLFAWARHLASFLCCKFINVWGQALSCWHSQDGVNVSVCEMFCCSSSQRTAARTGMCYQTCRASRAACRRSSGTVSRMIRENWTAPTESYLAFSALLQWCSMSSICMFTGTLSTSMENDWLLKSSKLNFLL